MTKIRVLFLLGISLFTYLSAIAISSKEVDSVRLEINTLVKEYNNKDIKLNDKINTAIELTFYYSGYYPGVRVKKMDSAFYYSEVAYDLSKMSKDSNLIYSAGTIYAEYQSGVGNYSKAISILLETKDKLNTNSYNDRIYSEISDTYREAGDFKNALKYAKLNLDYEIKHSESITSKLSLYVNVGDAYSNLNMLDSAFYYYNKDYANLLLIDKDKYSKYLNGGLFFSSWWVVIANMGEINFKLGENEIALTYFKKVIDAINKTKETSFCSEFYLTVAKCYSNLKQGDLALYYARGSYRIANDYNDNKSICESSLYLSQLFKQKNLPDSAYHYQSVFIKFKDSIYNNDQANKLAIISMEENIKQEKIKIQIEKEKHDRDQNLVLAGIGFFIPVFVSLVFLVSKWSKKKSKIFTSLGIASLLMLFEFISLLIHPYVEKFTNHNVAFMYIILLIVASALVPLHHKMENYFKNYFQE
jgi:tetratricopeptide (TPR) repeat protein